VLPATRDGQEGPVRPVDRQPGPGPGRLQSTGDDPSRTAQRSTGTTTRLATGILRTSLPTQSVLRVLLVALSREGNLLRDFLSLYRNRNPKPAENLDFLTPVADRQPQWEMADFRHFVEVLRMAETGPETRPPSLRRLLAMTSNARNRSHSAAVTTPAS
jgi:hypothetical protein